MTDATEPRDRRSYRDELNFAEFPLASLSDSTAKGEKTLVFNDTVFDRGRNSPVRRSLTISASDEYGLPTALDDELILGLIQLTNQRGFAERKVHFTRYELIKLLGWRLESKSYDRVEESMKRWLGVTLYYDKAWWSKEEQCWVDENFHILDQVTIYDRERRSRRIKANPSDGDAGRSSFMWNEVVFNSFKSGYLKQLDYDFLKSLSSHIAKRIYRFLDKRFYQRARLEFDLREFACEHIGLSKNYINPEIKRQLKGPILELESRVFLKAIPWEDRFIAVRKGEWKIAFERAETVSTMKKGRGEVVEAAHKISKSRSRKDDGHEEGFAEGMVRALTERGISKSTAKILSQTHSVDYLREKLAVFDWMIKNKDGRISRNPAGFLYKAITEDFAAPKDFSNPLPPAPVCTAVKSHLPASAVKEDETEAEKAEIEEYWNSMSEAEQQAFEQDALQMTDNFLRKQYEEGRAGETSLYKAVRQIIIAQHVRRVVSHVGKEAA